LAFDFGDIAVAACGFTEAFHRRRIGANVSRRRNVRMNITPDIIRAIQSAHRHDMVELLPIHVPAVGENAVPGTKVNTTAYWSRDNNDSPKKDPRATKGHTTLLASGPNISAILAP
jgi:hypothetical protein